jgi:hypothetical protein
MERDGAKRNCGGAAQVAGRPGELTFSGYLRGLPEKIFRGGFGGPARCTRGLVGKFHSCDVGEDPEFGVALGQSWHTDHPGVAGPFADRPRTGLNVAFEEGFFLEVKFSGAHDIACDNAIDDDLWRLDGMREGDFGAPLHNEPATTNGAFYDYALGTNLGMDGGMRADRDHAV